MTWIKENAIPILMVVLMTGGTYTTAMVKMNSTDKMVEVLNERVDAQGVHIANLGNRMNSVERDGDKAIEAVKNLVKATSNLAQTNNRLVISVAKLEVRLAGKM